MFVTTKSREGLPLHIPSLHLYPFSVQRLSPSELPLCRVNTETPFTVLPCTFDESGSPCLRYQDLRPPESPFPNSPLIHSVGSEGIFITSVETPPLFWIQNVNTFFLKHFILVVTIVLKVMTLIVQEPSDYRFITF